MNTRIPFSNFEFFVVVVGSSDEKVKVPKNDSKIDFWGKKRVEVLRHMIQAVCSARSVSKRTGDKETQIKRNKRGRKVRRRQRLIRVSRFTSWY